MRIAVSVESANDLSQELLSQYDIKVTPFTIVLGDESFKDGEKTVAQLFEEVERTGVLPKTTAINEFEYGEFFQELKKENDAVIHIALSSGISSTCGNAVRAAENLSDVYVVDSKSLSLGIGLLAVYCRELANQGLSAKEIHKILTERAEKLQTSFVVDRLDYLHKGGRCNSVQLLGANVLKIHPRISMKGGKMAMDKKYRGSMGNVMSKYCQELFIEYPNIDLDKIFVAYTSATPEMLLAVRLACEKAGFDKVYECFAGGTVASHCGENTLGLMFFYE